jgi:transcriptional regulator with XRE-family HTH domain
MIDEGFPIRLREERKRKGLSQTEFAALGGVKKLSQLQYEKGERLPSLEYIASLVRCDRQIDVGFILTGVRSDKERLEKEALWRVLGHVQGWLSLTQFDEEFHAALMLALEEQTQFWEGKEFGSASFDAVRAILAKSPKVILSPHDLAEVIERIEFVLGAKGCSLEPSSKAQAILKAYEFSKTGNGRLDLQKIEEAITWVTGEKRSSIG